MIEFKPNKLKLSALQYVQCYEKMLLIRRFEEKCGQFYGMGLIGGFCHLYIGQEAVIMGFEFAKQKGDSMITSYRDHAHIIMSGIDPKFVMAELTGRASGCSKGKGGSMHMFDIPGKFYGGHGIVGAQVPIGTGLAFAEKYNNTKKICNYIDGIYDMLMEMESVYEDCGRIINKRVVVEKWDSMILDFEYLYYVMKGDYKKFNEDGVVFKSISKRGFND